MFHGSPNYVDEYIYPDKCQKILINDISSKFDVILFGHTHHQFVSCLDNTLIINPGSIGQARDIRGLAAYAIYDTESNSVLPLRLKYNYKKIVQKINEVEDGNERMIFSIKGYET